MKIIFVQLANKAGEVAVLEMLGQNSFGKAFVLHEPSGYCFRVANCDLDGFQPQARQNCPRHRPTSPPTNMSDLRAFFTPCISKFSLQPTGVPTCKAFGPKHYLINFVVWIFKQWQRRANLRSHWNCLRRWRQFPDSHPFCRRSALKMQVVRRWKKWYEIRH